MDDKTEKVRARAHEIWESEGRPHGSHDRHWQQASDEVSQDDDISAETDPDAASLGKSRKPRTPSKKI